MNPDEVLLNILKARDKMKDQTPPNNTDIDTGWLELREKLASIEHERWADWQKWMHSKMVEHSNGKGEWVCLPAELFKRWERQIATKYEDLAGSEKASDMEQVDRYWPLIEAHITKAVAEARIEEHKLFEKWLYDPSVGVGTIHDWSQNRIQALKGEERK